MTRADGRLSWWQQRRERRKLRHDLELELAEQQRRADRLEQLVPVLRRSVDSHRAAQSAAIRAAHDLSERLSAIQLVLGDGDRTVEQRLDRIAQVCMEATPRQASTQEEYTPYGG